MPETFANKKSTVEKGFVWSGYCCTCKMKLHRCLPLNPSTDNPNFQTNRSPVEITLRSLVCFNPHAWFQIHLIWENFAWYQFFSVCGWCCRCPPNRVRGLCAPGLSATVGSREMTAATTMSAIVAREYAKQNHGFVALVVCSAFCPCKMMQNNESDGGNYPHPISVASFRCVNDDRPPGCPFRDLGMTSGWLTYFLTPATDFWSC